MGQPLKKLKPQTLRTGVTDTLRAAIVTGQLIPGEHLKETEIARQLEVSRSPVREAFRLLEQEGLIVSIPNQGCFVKEFDAQEIAEIYTLRAALENLSYEIILKEDNLTPEHWQRLQEFIEDQSKAIELHRFDELAQLDMDFHEYLCRLSGHNRLAEMWQSLRGQILILFFQRFLMFDWIPKTVIQHHTQILNTLRAGDIQALIELNNAINERVAQECIDLLTSSEQELPTKGSLE